MKKVLRKLLCGSVALSMLLSVIPSLSFTAFAVDSYTVNHTSRQITISENCTMTGDEVSNIIGTDTNTWYIYMETNAKLSGGTINSSVRIGRTNVNTVTGTTVEYVTFNALDGSQSILQAEAYVGCTFNGNINMQYNPVELDNCTYIGTYNGANSESLLSIKHATNSTIQNANIEVTPYTESSLDADFTGTNVSSSYLFVDSNTNLMGGIYTDMTKFVGFDNISDASFVNSAIEGSGNFTNSSFFGGSITPTVLSATGNNITISEAKFYNNTDISAGPDIQSVYHEFTDGEKLVRYGQTVAEAFLEAEYLETPEQFNFYKNGSLISSSDPLDYIYSVYRISPKGDFPDGGESDTDISEDGSWYVENEILYITGKFGSKALASVTDYYIAIEVEESGNITGGSFGNQVGNNGTISGGSFNIVRNQGNIAGATIGSLDNDGNVEDSFLTEQVFNSESGTIVRGKFLEGAYISENNGAITVAHNVNGADVEFPLDGNVLSVLRNISESNWLCEGVAVSETDTVPLYYTSYTTENYNSDSSWYIENDSNGISALYITGNFGVAELEAAQAEGFALIYVQKDGVITEGEYLDPVHNSGTIENATLHEVYNSGTIKNAILMQMVNNSGIIDSCYFYGSIEENTGTISVMHNVNGVDKAFLLDENFYAALREISDETWYWSESKEESDIVNDDGSTTPLVYAILVSESYEPGSSTGGEGDVSDANSWYIESTGDGIRELYINGKFGSEALAEAEAIGFDNVHIIAGGNITGGTFTAMVYVEEDGTITGGTFDSLYNNSTTSTVTNATIKTYLYNGGTTVTNCRISGEVWNFGKIESCYFENATIGDTYSPITAIHNVNGTDMALTYGENAIAALNTALSLTEAEWYYNDVLLTETDTIALDYGTYTYKETEAVELTLTQDVVNVKGLAKSATLIVASYDETTNQLIDCKYMTVTESITKTLAETELTYSAGDVVKAFLWSDMSTLTPLCDGKEITTK